MSNSLTSPTVRDHSARTSPISVHPGDDIALC
ncbi:hypothetical protein K3495_g13863 [Podosphaera aphanis]|nr:hypothetical protein K3495_g13863 [Podosphaera aphanis]